MIIFEAKSENGGSIFTHTESFGMIKSKNPFAEKVANLVLGVLLNPIYRFDLIKKDIIEDNENLKDLIEGKAG